jgi:diadenosine tetraphosphate (Ap4A) HIT family hydrolase
MRKLIVYLFCFSFLLLFIASLFVDKIEKKIKLCPLCEIEAFKFYEDEFMVCLAPSHPLSRGNALIVPKRHIERFEELSLKEFLHLRKIVNILNKTIKNLYETEDYVIVFEKNKLNSPHSYFNYIPQKNNDISFSKMRWLKTPFDRKDSYLELMRLKTLFNELKEENFLSSALPDERHSQDDQTLAGDHSK